MKGRTMITLLGLLLLLSCSKERGKSLLNISFSDAYSYPSIVRLKSAARPMMGDIHIPDTNDFILSIVKGESETVYKGSYGQRPVPLSLSSGTYRIGVYSCEFEIPAFEQAQFGDEQVLVVHGGESIDIAFLCRQLNCGVGLSFGQNLLRKYPGAGALLSSDRGDLPYPFTEKRLAFFHPGTVDIALENGGERIPVASRDLQPASILQLRLDSTSPDPPEGEGVSISVDTTRTWHHEDIMVGAANDGSCIEKALEVGELKRWIGAKKVWVSGYIVGGDISTSKISFQPPFTSATHLAMASAPGVTGREECVAVELPDRKNIRDSLSLVTDPHLLGRKLWIKGDIVDSYFKLVGVKNSSEFRLQK